MMAFFSKKLSIKQKNDFEIMQGFGDDDGRCKSLRKRSAAVGLC